MAKRVVVTGLGMITPLGNDVATTWQNLIAGKSGIDRITLFDSAGFDTQIGGEVTGFRPEESGMDRKEARRMDRYALFASASAGEALRDSGLTINEQNRDRVGVVIGSGIGGIGSLSEQFKVLHEKGPQRVSPFLVPMMIA